MESDYRNAVRTALAYGEGVALAKTLVSQMTDKERLAVIRYAGFLSRRKTLKWFLGHERVLVKNLPDSSIERIIKSRQGKIVIRALQTHNNWAIRQPEYIILQEAQFRGLDIEWWGEKDIARVRRRLFGDCLDGRHSYTTYDGGILCLNCQKRVADDVVIKEMPKELDLL